MCERVSPDHQDYIFDSHFLVYKFASQFVKDKLVLDVGCGTAYGSNYFLTKGAKYVYAIDNSQEALDYAHKNFPNHRLLYYLMDAQDLKFVDETFDIVFSSENLEHLQNPEKSIAHIKRVLKKDGIFILGTPNKENFEPESDKSSNPYHLKEFFYEELKALLKKYFDSVYIFESSLPNLLKDKRRLMGKIGIEPNTEDTIQLGKIKVNLEHLHNTHSFLVIAW